MVCYELHLDAMESINNVAMLCYEDYDQHCLNLGIQWEYDPAVGTATSYYTPKNNYELRDLVLMEQQVLGAFPYRTLPELACRSISKKAKWAPGHNNSLTNIAMRVKAKKFITEVDFDSVWRWIANRYSYSDIAFDFVSYPVMYSVVYCLTCMRNAVLVKDFRRRSIPYNPRYTFENPIAFAFEDWMYKENAWYSHYLSCWIISFFLDISIDLFSEYNFKHDSEDYLINSYSEQDLIQLAGIRWMNTMGGSPVLAPVLRCFWKYFVVFDALLRRQELNKEQIQLADAIYTMAFNSNNMVLACVKLLKLIFKKISVLEQYAKSI